MFGYIKPQQSELLVKEYEFYKAVYCGLCRTGGKRISRLTRFFLNNDFVFLCIVQMAVKNENVCAGVKRCPYGLKRKCMVCESESLVYTCAAFGILLYYKACDDVMDSRFFRRFFSRIARAFTKPMMKKAAKMYPELEKGVREGLEKLYSLEKQSCKSPDEAADCFAGITRLIAAGGQESEKKEILEQCGYHIGRYIYLIDALDDCVEDEKKKRFNVFNNYFGSAEKALEQKEIIRTTLEDSIAAFCRAYEKNGGSRFDNLIYNTAQLGTRNAYASVVEKLKGNKK